MASHAVRLRRHAQDSPSSNLEESFVSLGTPLPSLTSTTPSGNPKRDANEFLPLWQQEVRDAQGRRRLHGAFTGGFSAGYYNTVGSKEGWKPKEFKSSRAERFAGKLQTAEDFMDDEDLEELRNSKELKTSSRFQAPQQDQQTSYDPFAHLGTVAAAAGGLAPAPPPDRPSDAAPDRFSADLVRPSASRAGEKLLQKMGWRAGQGVGPRVTRKRRRQIAAELGVAIPDSEEGEEEGDKHLYAPPDRPLVLYPPRDTTAGLGYTRAHSTLARPTSTSTSARAGKGVDGLPSGASFGLGALNDFEVEDEDVYATGDRGRQGRVLVPEDEAEDDGDDPPSIPSWLSSMQQKRPQGGPKGFFRDGTPMLRNFTPALTQTLTPTSASTATAGREGGRQTWWRAPEVPKGWEPDPQRLWREMERLRLGAGADVARGDARAAAGEKGAMMTADERGRLLGEQQLPAPPKSVFDYISAKDRARLAALQSSSQKPPVASSVPAEPSVPLQIPHLDPSLALAALKGFIPFAHDPSRQKRYVLFLQHSSSTLPPGVTFSPKPQPKVKGLERMEGVNKELEDFRKSAEMFKPMSTAMAARFTSASGEGQRADAQAAHSQVSGLRHFVPSTPADNAPAKEEKQEEELTTAQHAVRTGMFGPLTRTVADWYPDRLVCKRFNVPDPHPEGRPVNVAAGAGSTRMDEFLASQGFHTAEPDVPRAAAEEERADGGDEGEREGGEEGGSWTIGVKEAPPRPLAQVGLGDDDENQGRETLTVKRPPMDLFKAIFGDGDDDESEQAENIALDDDVEDGKAEKVEGDGKENDSMPVDEAVAAPPPPAASEYAPGPLAGLLSSSIPTVVDTASTAASMAAFRPTFKRKGDRAANGDGSATGKKVAKKGRNEKRKVAITSFGGDEEEDNEEGGEGGAEEAMRKAREKKRKHDEKRKEEKKRKKDRGGGAEEEMLWVEKEVSASTLAPAPKTSAPVARAGRSARARAADLMDDE